MEILFVLRLNQRNKTRPATIYCRITINGQRAGDFSTFGHVLPDDWHAKGQVVVAGTEEAQLTNDALTNIRNEIRSVYNRLKAEKLTITAVRVKALYLQKGEPQRTFLETFAQLIERKKILKRSKGTIQANTYKYDNIENFLKATGRRDLLPGDFSESLADELEFWLRSNLPSCGTEHVAKHLQLVKETLKLAVKQGDITTNPLQHMVLKRGKPKKPVFLTLAELKEIESLQFVSPTLQMTADLFVFCCYTGFAYEDLSSFNPKKNVKPGPDAQLWIYKERGKTDEIAMLPLFEGARRIMEKYQGKLPKIINDHYNNYIKQVAAIAGLDIKVTTHTARKTAANIWHNEGGVAMDDVALMLGHADPETTRKYYVQTDTRKLMQATERMRKLLS